MPDPSIRAIMRSALVTEFDQTNQDGLKHAVETDLFFGFGAEARQLIVSFDLASKQRPYLSALSWIVDGEHLPINHYTSMESCDSIAALWSMIAAEDSATLVAVNGAAIAKNFQRLPRHLRAALGAKVSLRLLRSGDTANAQVVRKAFEHALTDQDPAVARLAAQQAIHHGEHMLAETYLQETDKGLDALLTLSEARFRQLSPLENKDLTSLEAYAFDQGRGPHAAEITRAHARAKALAGDFQTAFHLAASSEAPSDLETDIWFTLGHRGGFPDLLTHAVGAAPSTVKALPAPLRAQIGQRLIEAGLPNAALAWLPDRSATPDLAAQALVANNDARSALSILATNIEAADPALLAEAYQMLGATAESISTLYASGHRDEAQRQERWLGNWSAFENEITPPEPTQPNIPTSQPAASLSAASSTEVTASQARSSLPAQAASKSLPAWRDLLALNTKPSIPSERPGTMPLQPLEEGKALLTQSEQTRAAIKSLLAQVPPPSAMPPNANR